MRTQLLAAAALLASGAFAQNQLPLQGFLYNWDRPALGDGVSLFVRFNLPAEELLSRVDRDDHKDWGLNAAGQISIQGFLSWILDVTDATRESFSIVGYTEDPARPNFPLTTTRVMNVGPIQMPPTGATPGQVAYRVGATFTTPVTFANGGDVFLGVSVPVALASGATLTDGLFVGSANVDSSAGVGAVFDLPGPRGQVGGLISQQSYLCYNPAAGPTYIPATALSCEQLAIDVFLGGGTVGGIALTQTNQSAYPSSGPGLGTSNFLSGLHPDVNGSNTGRADNLGFAVTSGISQVGAGNPVFIMMAFGPSPAGTLPIATLAGTAAGPDTAGFVCIDFTTAASFLTFLTTAQPNSLNIVAEAQLNIPLNAGTRAAIASLPSPIDLWWQGFAVDTSAVGPGLEIRGTGCVIQHIK